MYDTIGKRIRDRREELGMSQRDVAEKIELSQPAYIRYEHDKIRRHSRIILEKIADALNMPFEQLIGTRQDKTLDHFPGYIQQFLRNPESLPYIKEAYIKFVENDI